MGVLGTAVMRPVPDNGTFGVYFGAEDNTAGTAFTTSDGSGYAHVDYAQVDGTAIANTGSMVAPSTRITNLFPLNGIVSMSVRRGRTRPDQYDDVGEMIVTVNNQGDSTLAGASDPDNNAGRYKRLSTSGGSQVYSSFLQPQMFGRLSYQPTSGTIVHLFTGLLESAVPTDDIWSTTTFTFIDRLSVIGKTSINPKTMAGFADSTGNARLNLLIENGGLPNVVNTNGSATIIYEQANTSYTGSYRDVTGFTKTVTKQTVKDSALDSLKEVVDGEAGRLFCNRDGILCAYDRPTLQTRAATPVATFSDTSTISGYGYDEIHLNQAQDYIYNKCVVSYGTSVVWTAISEASLATYGERSTSKSVVLSSTTDQSAAATFYATNYALPKKTPVSISLQTYGFTDAAFQTIAKIDLGQSVRVVRQQPGGRQFDGTAIVEGIELDLAPESRRFTFYLSATDQTTL